MLLTIEVCECVYKGGICYFALNLFIKQNRKKKNSTDMGILEDHF
jgi:hypothetical protein